MRSRVSGRPAGFSLVEAALSLAIVSFALVAIMGLLPVALQTSKESNRETRATMIARRIVDELQSLPATNTALVRGPSVTNSAWRITGLDLSTASTNILLYDDQAEGLTNQIAPESFPSSISAPKALFAAEVRVTPNYPWPGISRVQAKIETPSDAPSSKRSSFLFVTFMNPRQ